MTIARPFGPSLYVIGAGGHSNDPVKIGRAESPALRLADLQVAHHQELSILAEARIDDVTDEQRVHDLFCADRIRGEWFRRTPEIVKFISILKLGVHRAVADVLTSRAAKRTLDWRERDIKRWFERNLPPLGPRPIASLVPPPPLTQTDADRMAAAVSRAGIHVARGFVRSGSVVLEFGPADSIQIGARIE